RFWAVAERASSSAAVRRKSCIRGLDPSPLPKVCKVFEKGNLGLDFGVLVKYRSRTLLGLIVTVVSSVAVSFCDGGEGAASNRTYVQRKGLLSCQSDFAISPNFDRAARSNRFGCAD